MHRKREVEGPRLHPVQQQCGEARPGVLSGRSGSLRGYPGDVSNTFASHRMRPRPLHGPTRTHHRTSHHLPLHRNRRSE
jgi:hypothetical protein